MKRRFSDKDLLLLIGVLVAVVVGVMTLVYKEKPSEAQQMVPLPKKTSIMVSPSDIAKKVFEKVVMITPQKPSR